MQRTRLHWTYISLVKVIPFSFFLFPVRSVLVYMREYCDRGINNLTYLHVSSHPEYGQVVSLSVYVHACEPEQLDGFY
jgi:hypothetical protein